MLSHNCLSLLEGESLVINCHNFHMIRQVFKTLRGQSLLGWKYCWQFKGKERTIVEEKRKVDLYQASCAQTQSCLTE